MWATSLVVGLAPRWLQALEAAGTEPAAVPGPMQAGGPGCAAEEPRPPAFPAVSLCRSPSSTKASVSGDAGVYRSLTTLARALAQYLLLLPKLPGHLHLPPEKERDTVKFVVMTLEVRAGTVTGQGTGGRSPSEDERSGVGSSLERTPSIQPP